MVISLESQNVKVKKSLYFPKKSINVVKFNIPFNFDHILNLRISDYIIPYIISLFLFSILFSSGWGIFLPHGVIDSDLTKIVLPAHGADVLSKSMIVNFSGNRSSSYFTIQNYHENETLSSIAIKYGVSRETLLHVNDIDDVRELKNFSSLKIPISDGVIYRLSNKDTLESISSKFGVLVKDIFRVNGLKTENLNGLEKLFIPGVSPTNWGWRSNLDKYFVYPVNGLITKRYGFHTNSFTGLTSLYEGIDFIATGGDEVFASKSGHISRIGYNPSYGHYIYVDHSGGSRTLYAHLDEINVSIRDYVKQGDVIGLIGKSGFTSSKKLFFCLFNRDNSIDPEEYLK